MTVAQGLARLRSAMSDGRLDQLCEDLGVRVLTVFGSAARDADTAADLDVAVSYRDPSAADQLATIDALMVLTGIDEVDLLVLDGASPTARRNALVGVIPAFEAAAGDFAVLQMTAIVDFMDTAWLRRLDLDLMTR